MKLRKGALYLFLAVNLGLVLFRWFQGASPLFVSAAGAAIAAGRLAGLLLEMGIAFMFILIGRIPLVEQAFGHDRMNKVHRLTGYSLSALLVAHPLLLIWGYAQMTGLGYLGQFSDFVLHVEDVLNAVLGILLLAVVITLSLPYIRRSLKREYWHAAHLLVYPVFVLVIGHQTATDMIGWWQFYWYGLNFGALGLLALYRFGRPLLLAWRHDFQVRQVVRENENTASLVLSGKNLEQFKFKPGQFANILVLRRGMWSPHPFSFSAAPDGQTVRFTIKADGDFTSRVTEIPVGTRVVIDGPLGRFTEDAAAGRKFLLVAGGVGITPIRALAERLSQEAADAVLLYSAKDGSQFLFKDELQKFVPQAHFIETRPEGGAPGGRLDADQILRLAPDLKEREIYICGPGPMIDSLVAAVRALGVPRTQVHYERFVM